MAMIYGVPLLLGSVGSYFVGNMLEELKTEPQPQAEPQAQSSWFGGPAQPQSQPQSSWFGGPAQYAQQPQSSWFGNQQQQFREDAYREALQQTTKKADAAEKQVREANAAIMAAQRSQDAAALESAQRSRSEAQAELLAVKQEMARQASEVAAKSAEAEKRARAADQMILDARRDNDQAALEEAKKARQAAEEEKMTMAKELQELKTAAAKQPVSVAPPIVEPPPAPAPSPVVEPTPKTPQNVLDGILGARTNADQIEPVEEEDYELEEEDEEEEVQPEALQPPKVVEAPTPPAVQPPTEPPPAVQPPTEPPPAVQAPTQPTPDELRQQLFANATANPELRARYEPEGPSQLSDSQALFANATPNPELQDKYRRDNEVDVRQQAEAEAGIPEQNPFEAESPPPPAEQPQSDGWTPLDINNMNTGVYIMPGLFGAAGATYIPTIYKFFNQPKMKDNINVSDEDKFAKIAEAQTSMRTYLESLKAKMAVSAGKAKDDIVSLGKEAVNTFKILLDNFKSQEQTDKRRTELETRQGKIKAASDKEAAIIESSRKKTAQLSSDLDNLKMQLSEPDNTPLGRSKTRRIANPIFQEVQMNKNRSTRRR